MLSDASGPVVQIRGANQRERELDLEQLFPACRNPCDRFCRLSDLFARALRQFRGLGRLARSNHGVCSSPNAVTRSNPERSLPKRRFRHDDALMRHDDALMSHVGQCHRCMCIPLGSDLRLAKKFVSLPYRDEILATTRTRSRGKNPRFITRVPDRVELYSTGLVLYIDYVPYLRTYVKYGCRNNVFDDSENLQPIPLRRTVL